jgi:hypothetical protein
VIQCLIASAVTSLGSPDRLIWLCGRSRRLTSELKDWNAAGGLPPRFDLPVAVRPTHIPSHFVPSVPTQTERPWESIRSANKDPVMLYALLAYHVEADVMSWTPQEDAAVMAGLREAHGRIRQNGRLGPAARLGGTAGARTLRGPGKGAVIDGPFAETKEQLLGFYILDVATEEAALDAARELRRVNPSAVYELRPIQLFLSGDPMAATDATDAS